MLVHDIRSTTYLVNNIFVFCFFCFVFVLFVFSEKKPLLEKKNYVFDLESIEIVKCSNEDPSQNISWYNGSTGVKIKSGGRTELNGLSLKIKNVQLDDAGTYECRAMSSTRFYTIYVNCEFSLCSCSFTSVLFSLHGMHLNTNKMQCFLVLIILWLMLFLNIYYSIIVTKNIIIILLMLILIIMITVVIITSIYKILR